MKIIWFTNTPCSASEILVPGNNGGGWLSSLEKGISSISDIELHIVFYHNKKIEKFIHNKTHFYPIYRKYNTSKISRFFARLFNFGNNDEKEISNLVKIINKVGPDIIHIHGTEENFGLIQEKVTIPVIISIQGLLCSISEKYFTGIPSSVAQQFENYKSKLFLTTASNSYLTLKRKVERERRILLNSKHIIGRTEYDQLITRALAPNSNYYIGQEILRPLFYKKPKWIKTNFNKKICIVSIIGDNSYKGVETILKTSLILKTFLNFDFEWKIAGIKRNSYFLSISEAWLKLDHETLNIVTLGSINESEIYNLLISSDIYCQVSHIENSPNSLCEAMMIGMPCIASFAGGTGSILENGKEGILYQDGDPYYLAGAILSMSTNFDQAIKFGHDGRQKAIIRHNPEDIIEKLTKIYYSVNNIS